MLGLAPPGKLGNGQRLVPTSGAKARPAAGAQAVKRPRPVSFVDHQECTYCCHLYAALAPSLDHAPAPDALPGMAALLNLFGRQ